MKVNTALCFILAGVALRLLQPKSRTPMTCRLALLCAFLTCLIGLLTITEYQFQWNLGIDEILLQQTPEPIIAAFPGRMSLVTALVFFLLGLALLLLGLERWFSRAVAQVIALLTAAILLIGLIGYLYNVNPFYQIAAFSTMALHTAVTAELLCLGILLAQPDEGYVAAFVSNHSGGVMARRMLPFVIVLPIVVGWIRLLGQQAGFYDTIFGIVLLVVAFIFSFVIVLWVNAHALNQIDAARVQTGNELRDSEEHLRLATEAMKMGTWDRDLQSDKLFWSPSMERLMEFEPASFPGTFEAFAQFVYPDDREALRLAQQKARNNSGHYQAELRFITRTGRVRWGLIYGQMLFDQQGIPIRMVGVDLDITDRKKIEEDLRASEQRFKTLVEQASDAFFVHDTDGKFLDVNQRACETLGYSREELLGMNVFDIELDFDLKQAQKAWSEIAPGTADTLIGHQRRRDGTIFPVEVRWSCFDFQGQRLFLDLVRDISERQQAEEALRQSELRYRELAESLPQLVWTCDANGACDYLSPQWVAYTGIPAHEQLEYGWLEQIDPHDRERTITSWEKAKTAGEVFDSEFRIRRHDGVYHWFRTRATPIFDENQQLLKWFGSNTDIEDIKQAQERVQQVNIDLENRVTIRTEELASANRELEAFAYSVSHDLRAPLRAIDGFSRILMEDYSAELTADAAEYLHLVRDNTQRMGHLIDDLLNFSRLNRQAFQRQSVDLGALVQRVLAELEREREGRQIEITLEELPLCSADPALLKQVYINLLTNAFKFTKTRPVAVITIGCLTDDKAAPIFFVKDNGVGFDMKYLHKVFDVFQRLHRAEDYEGTGVGLAIVQRIIQRHGGRVWAEAAVNEGATFFFTLEGTRTDG